jgi:origin recognition complex subunit 1
MIRINFQPYTTSQLEAIVHARLASAQEGMPEKFSKEVVHKDGIKFAAMKVSSISGDARRVLDICRCALISNCLLLSENLLMLPVFRRAVELVHADKRTARTDDVKEVIKAMQNSPTAAYLRECSFHERLMLASLVKCVKRAGVEEIQWREVLDDKLISLALIITEAFVLCRYSISS